MRTFLFVFALIAGILPGITHACTSEVGPTPITLPSADVRLSELMPAPIEGEEFIELQIVTGGSFDGWTVRDASGKSSPIANGIEGNGFLLLWQSTSKIYLNNSGDIIELIDPTGTVVDVVEYGAFSPGSTWSLVENKWSESTPTPGSANLALQVLNETEGPAQETKPAIDSPEPTMSTVTIAEAITSEKGEIVLVEGVVTSSFGQIGSRSAYIEDDTGGIQLYISSGDLPELPEGTVIRLSGKKSSYLEEPRLLLSSDDIEIVGEDAYEPLTTNNLDISIVGTFVQTVGEVIDKDAQHVYLDSGILVYRKSSSATSFKDVEEGEQVRISGIVTLSKEEVRLIPRTQADIEKFEPETVSNPSLIEEASAAGESTGMKETSKTQWKTIVGYSIGAILAIGYVAYRNRERIKGLLYTSSKKIS